MLEVERNVPEIVREIEPSAKRVVDSQLFVVGPHPPQVEAQVLAALEGRGREAEVGADQVVVAGAVGVASGDDEAHRRLGEDVAADSGRQEILAVQGPDGIVHLERVHRSGLHVEKAQVVVAHPARELGPRRYRHLLPLDEADPAREEGDEVDVGGAEARDIVSAGSFQEELTFLRKEQREAREVDLPLVRFGLREIGVDGQHGREVRSDVLGHVQAGLEPGVTLLLASRNIGPKLPALALAGPLKPAQEARLREVREPNVLTGRGPAILLLLPLDLALHVEAPGVLFRLEAQGLEGDRELGRPALVGATRRRVPDSVPVVGRSLLVIGDLPVAARSRRVHLEEEAVAPVEEGIEHDGDVVVDLEQRVAGELRRDNGSCLAVVADDAQVQVVRIEKDPDLGVLGRRLQLVGHSLHEGTDRSGRCPCGLVELAIELDLVGGSDRHGARHGRRERRLRGRAQGHEPRQQHRHQEAASGGQGPRFTRRVLRRSPARGPGLARRPACPPASRSRDLCPRTSG